MIDQSKTKIVGAFVVGFAIVAGTFVVKNFGHSSVLPPTNLTAAAAETTNRVTIEVTDNNADGLEDWREQFVKSSPIVLQIEDEDYVVPETLTGQMGIAFLQSIITSEGHGGIGRSKEQIIEDTVEKVSTFATDRTFDYKDIIISEDSSPEALRTYANAHADAIMSNSVPELRHELLILREVLDDPNSNGIAELKALSKVYLDTRNEVVKLPVPAQLAKEHLDLINVYHAIYGDIESMTKAVADPMLSLVRLKRYEEDAEGLGMALQNMYGALEPYANAFQKDDSAILFVGFSPDLQ
jgi:hypothetical protein